MDWREEYTLERITYNPDGDVDSRVYHAFAAEELNELLEQFTYFLMGCSYTYVKGLEAKRESD
tara:strand:- start:483 stop:671 length:189 start_codon:yes stop_codon:yes gene_type:complete